MKLESLTDSLQIAHECPDSAAHASDTCIQVPLPQGMQGEPMPYKMESDEAVIGAITVCFILILVALKKGAKSLLAYLKYSLTFRRRSNLFDDHTTSSSASSAVLCISTMISSGICLYHHYVDSSVTVDTKYTLVLFVYIFSFFVLIVGKSWLYNFVNWVFFDREKNKQWKQNYWGLIASSGVVLFPSVLYVVFLDAGFQISDYLLLTILAIFKILLFYKLIGNFFTHFYGVSHLILYFCALEIIPDLFLWKGVEIFNHLFLKL